MCDLVAEDESMNKPLTMFGTLTLSAVAFVRAASSYTYEFTDMWGTPLSAGYSQQL